MAITKYKVIKKNLDAVINYAMNGEKTENGILVSAINCLPQTAYSQMMLTKKAFHKEDGRLGYHIIQSFNGNEISPDKCNKIGIELAKQLWGDKYQVIVCTHIANYNRDSGKMELIKNDIDEAIKEATKYQEFVDILAFKGYYIKKSNNVISISNPYYNRNIRLARAFGKDYTFNADKAIIQAKIDIIIEDINKINSKIQTCKRIIDRVEKGEKETVLIKNRVSENQLNNEQENTKKKDRKRIR